MKIFTEENYKPNSALIPPMMVIYGECGVGKSTFCSQFQNPFFFDFERRTDHIKNIARDRDYGVSIDNYQSWNYFLQAVIELKESKFKTIIFDGVSRLQIFGWKMVGLKLNTIDPKGLAFGRGYSELYALFASLMDATKNLQRNYNKTIIFTDHEKLKEDQENNQYQKYVPECQNGILKILVKEVDYILRMIDDVTINHSKKAKEKNIEFNGITLLTNRQKYPSSMLKTSLNLPSKINASYDDFAQAYKQAQNQTT